MIDRAPPGRRGPTSELILLLNRDVARKMPELRYYEIRQSSRSLSFDREVAQVIDDRNRAIKTSPSGCGPEKIQWRSLNHDGIVIDDAQDV